MLPSKKTSFQIVQGNITPRLSPGFFLSHTCNEMQKYINNPTVYAIKFPLRNKMTYSMVMAIVSHVRMRSCDLDIPVKYCNFISKI